jgi:hypothetical protein
MIDPDKFFLVVKHQAVLGSGLSEREIRHRLCSRVTLSHRADDWLPGQRTTIETDGEYAITVTRTGKNAPDGSKKVAFVVDAKRIAAEQAPMPAGTSLATAQSPRLRRRHGW